MTAPTPAEGRSSLVPSGPVWAHGLEDKTERQKVRERDRKEGGGGGDERKVEWIEEENGEERSRQEGRGDERKGRKENGFEGTTHESYVLVLLIEYR